MMDIGKEIESRLEKLVKNLEADSPIKMIKVITHDTPDGPMHVHIGLNNERSDS